MNHIFYQSSYLLLRPEGPIGFYLKVYENYQVISRQARKAWFSLQIEIHTGMLCKRSIRSFFFVAREANRFWVIIYVADHRRFFERTELRNE